MERKRSVLAACGISVVLVVGSSAFAFANGVFVGKPEGGVGNFPAIPARPALAAAPAPRALVTNAPPPDVVGGEAVARHRSADESPPRSSRRTSSHNGARGRGLGRHDDEAEEHDEQDDVEHETAGHSERDD